MRLDTGGPTDGLALQLTRGDVQDLGADALLVPVDGALCRLGGAAAMALRASLPPEERDEELEAIGDELERQRPIPDGQARAIAGAARWQWLIAAAAYPHSKDGHVSSAGECANLLRAAIPRAIEAAAEAGASSMAMTVIGTAYRLTGEQAVRAQIDGLAAARNTRLEVAWAFREPDLLEVAHEAAVRVGLRVR